MVSYNPNTANMFLTLKTMNGESYALERCHRGHVWKQFNVTSFGENDSAPDDEADEVSLSQRTNPNRRVGDRENIVTYTVMIYYTAAFAAITADIPGFVESVIDETNQGYINSEIPVRIALHCIEAATISEVQSGSTFLSNFKNMKV